MGRWPEQWASSNATLVAQSMSKSLPYTVLVTHRRHELGLVWVWSFPVLQLPAQPCGSCLTKGRTRGDTEGTFGGVCTGDCRRVRAGTATLSLGRAEAARGEDVTRSQGRVKGRRATTTLWEGRKGAGAAQPWQGIRQSTQLTEFFGRTVVLGPGPSQQWECGRMGWQGRTQGSPGTSTAS